MSGPNQAFTEHRGRVVPLLLDNVDTDQIIPSREMKTVSRSGLADGLFAGWRYVDPLTRNPNPDFVLNHPQSKNATILRVGKNFGCGSSREHAVWALAEFGIRAIIADSFNEIFYGNCLRNGVLPIVLGAAAGRGGPDWTLFPDVTIDLPAQVMRCAAMPAWVGAFDIDAYPKRLLMQGLDPIGLTLTQEAMIDSFLEQDRQGRPWLYADYSAA